MNYVLQIIESLKTAKWWLIIIIALAGGIYIFNPTITKITEAYLIPPPNVQDGLTQDRMINDALEELRIVTASDVAYIMTFHNGTIYYTGTHKNKMSRDYEVTGNGIRSYAMQMQDIPVSLYTDILQVTIDGKFHYGDINEIPDIRTRMAYKNNGVSATSAAPYFDKDGNLVAIIGVEYVGSLPDPQQILDRTGMVKWDSKVLWRFFLTKTDEIGDLLV